MLLSVLATCLVESCPTWTRDERHFS
jgi:hypothetical protein